MQNAEMKSITQGFNTGLGIAAGLVVLRLLLKGPDVGTAQAALRHPDRRNGYPYDR